MRTPGFDILDAVAVRALEGASTGGGSDERVPEEHWHTGRGAGRGPDRSRDPLRCRGPRLLRRTDLAGRRSPEPRPQLEDPLGRRTRERGRLRPYLAHRTGLRRLLRDQLLLEPPGDPRRRNPSRDRGRHDPGLGTRDLERTHRRGGDLRPQSPIPPTPDQGLPAGRIDPGLSARRAADPGGVDESLALDLRLGHRRDDRGSAPGLPGHDPLARREHSDRQQ